MAQSLAEAQPFYVERFAKTFATFAGEVDDAVTAADLNPEFAGTRELEAWKKKALGLVQEKNARIQKAAEEFQAGKTQSIMEQAEDALGLAKDLDGFPLDFAGPDCQARLEKLQTAAVVAAYWVRKAGTSP